MDNPQSNPQPDPPQVLAYQQQTPAPPRPWHVFVSLALSWVPMAAVLLFLVQGLRSRNSILETVVVTLIAGASSGIAALLAYRAVAHPSRSDAASLAGLAAIPAALCTLFSLPTLHALNQLKPAEPRGLVMLAIAISCWFVVGSMWSWKRKLARAEAVEDMV